MPPVTPGTPSTAGERAASRLAAIYPLLPTPALPAGCGTVFELTPSTSGEWNETILHSFAFGTADGATPESGVTFDSAGNLYGTTFSGGSGTAYGTLYELTPSEG